MSHMDASQVIDLILGEEASGAADHLKSCRRCRQLHRTWIRRMESLRDLHRESLDEAESHRLRVMYRQLGPHPSVGGRWLASLVRASDGQLAAVRGVASGTILEYSAGPYNVLLRVATPDLRSTIAVYGQLTKDDGAPDLSGWASFVADDGADFICTLDRFGEFHLPSGAPGCYRVVLWVGGEVVEIDDLRIGIDGTH